MISWETFKAAAIQYSHLCPKRLRSDVELVADQTEYDPPDDEIVYSVKTFNRGTLVTVDEVSIIVEDEDNTTEYWAYDDYTSKLLVAPAPDAVEVAETPDVYTVWLCEHLPDEDTETFPTIPVKHLTYVEQLEQAADLETKADISDGKKDYTFGQTQVINSRKSASLRKSATAIRQAVEQALLGAEGVLY